MALSMLFFHSKADGGEDKFLAYLAVQETPLEETRHKSVERKEVCGSQ